MFQHARMNQLIKVLVSSIEAPAGWSAGESLVWCQLAVANFRQCSIAVGGEPPAVVLAGCGKPPVMVPDGSDGLH